MFCIEGGCFLDVSHLRGLKSACIGMGARTACVCVCVRERERESANRRWSFATRFCVVA
jgi:hypothetical protein